MIRIKHIVSCCFIILICLSCQKSNLEQIKEESAWDNKLWEALQKDSVFIEMGKLINNNTYYDQVYAIVKSTSPEQQDRCIREMNEERYAELNRLKAIIKEKYNDYSFMYFQKLYDIINKSQAKAMDEEEYELGEINIYGDCNYAIMTARDIIYSIDDLYSRFEARYPEYASTFNQRLTNGSLFVNELSFSEKRGLQIILSNRPRMLYPRCADIVEIAKQLKAVGTYMTKIRSLLREAVIYARANPKRPFPPQQEINIGPPAERGPQRYIKNSQDKLARKNMKLTMPKQLKNTCVTSIMEYVSDEYCGEGRNEGDFVLAYLQMSGKLVSDYGIENKYIWRLVSAFFDTPSYPGIQKSIDKKWVVMTTIPSKIKNSVHNVLIVGYTSDGNRYIYMDPEVGYLQHAPSRMFSGGKYYISISGCK